MGYKDQETLRVVLAQAERNKAEALRLKHAIADHYKELHKGNWGADDELWASIGLVADHTVIG